MIELDRDTQMALVTEAARAPSAHNTQPARWRFAAGAVELHEAVAARLTVADPEARDHRISLGIAWEGMTIALANRGLSVEEPAYEAPHQGDGRDYARVLTARLRDGAEPDPLAPEVDRRASYRGRFEAPSEAAQQSLFDYLERTPDLLSIVEPSAIAAAAKQNDRCAWSYLRRADYHRELCSWMRFSAADPGWQRDGLSADCLGLSPLEQPFLGLVFRPPGFGLMKAVGLGPLMSAEAPKVRSATALAVLHDAEGEDVFASGRRFYRRWLELSALDFHLCPMSALADHDEGAAWLRQHTGLAPGRRVVNVFRLGIAPTGAAVRSRRLPADELLV